MSRRRKQVKAEARQAAARVAGRRRSRWRVSLLIAAASLVLFVASVASSYTGEPGTITILNATGDPIVDVRVESDGGGGPVEFKEVEAHGSAVEVAPSGRIAGRLRVAFGLGADNTRMRMLYGLEPGGLRSATISLSGLRRSGPIGTVTWNLTGVRPFSIRDLFADARAGRFPGRRDFGPQMLQIGGPRPEAPAKVEIREAPAGAPKAGPAPPPAAGPPGPPAPGR